MAIACQCNVAIAVLRQSAQRKVASVRDKGVRLGQRGRITSEPVLRVPHAWSVAVARSRRHGPVSSKQQQQVQSGARAGLERRVVGQAYSACRLDEPKRCAARKDEEASIINPPAGVSTSFVRCAICCVEREEGPEEPGEQGPLLQTSAAGDSFPGGEGEAGKQTDRSSNAVGHLPSPPTGISHPTETRENEPTNDAASTILNFPCFRYSRPRQALCATADGPEFPDARGHSTGRSLPAEDKSQITSASAWVPMACSSRFGSVPKPRHRCAPAAGIVIRLTDEMHAGQNGTQTIKLKLATTTRLPPSDSLEAADIRPFCHQTTPSCVRVRPLFHPVEAAAAPLTAFGIWCLED